MKLQHTQIIHSGKKATFLEVIMKTTGLSKEESLLVIQIGGAYFAKLRCKDADRKIKDGDWVQAFFRLPVTVEEVPFHSDWVIEDNSNYLVANKPSGIPTQGRRDSDTTAFYEILKKNCPGYMGLHHRLDQGTSGLMLFSRSRGINRWFSTLFSEKRIQKHYLALCSGEWPGQDKVINMNKPIGRLAAHRGQGTCHGVMKTGKHAETIFELLGRDDDHMLILASPLTGRTHQIRVHAAHLGFPLIGDTLYGGPTVPDGGMFLHATRLQWEQHGQLEKGWFHAPLPATWNHQMSQTMVDIYEDWRERWLVS